MPSISTSPMRSPAPTIIMDGHAFPLPPKLVSTLVKDQTGEKDGSVVSAILCGVFNGFRQAAHSATIRAGNSCAMLSAYLAATHSSRGPCPLFGAHLDARWDQKADAFKVDKRTLAGIDVRRFLTIRGMLERREPFVAQDFRCPPVGQWSKVDVTTKAKKWPEIDLVQAYHDDEGVYTVVVTEIKIGRQLDTKNAREQCLQLVKNYSLIEAFLRGQPGVAVRSGALVIGASDGAMARKMFRDAPDDLVEQGLPADATFFHNLSDFLREARLPACSLVEFLAPISTIGLMMERWITLHVQMETMGLAYFQAQGDGELAANYQKTLDLIHERRTFFEQNPERLHGLMAIYVHNSLKEESGVPSDAEALVDGEILTTSSHDRVVETTSGMETADVVETAAVVHPLVVVGLSMACEGQEIPDPRPLASPEASPVEPLGHAGPTPMWEESLRKFVERQRMRRQSNLTSRSALSNPLTASMT